MCYWRYRANISLSLSFCHRRTDASALDRLASITHLQRPNDSHNTNFVSIVTTHTPIPSNILLTACQCKHIVFLTAPRPVESTISVRIYICSCKGRFPSDTVIRTALYERHFRCFFRVILLSYISENRASNENSILYTLFCVLNRAFNRNVLPWMKDTFIMPKREMPTFSMHLGCTNKS